MIVLSQSTTFPLVILLLCVSFAFFFFAYRKRNAIGLPKGRIVYIDTQNMKSNARALYHPKLRITGKPDYLVKDGNQIIPVEIKSSRVHSSPYDQHILQLGIYCLLVHQEFGSRPEYGILHYQNCSYKIPYTSGLEKTVLETINRMRFQESQAQVARSHNSPQRCKHCGYRENCDQRLL